MGIDRAMHYAETNTVEGWLQTSAAEVLCAVAEHIDMSARPVCEIGVHHGRTAIFLGILTRGRLVAYDLFERQDENIDSSGRGSKNKFLKNAKNFGIEPANTFAISANSLDLDRECVLEACGERPVLFSVDGGHTAELTINDLEIAASVVASDGVVMLDDFFNEWYPEVSWGTVCFLNEKPESLIPFCIAGGKIFFATNIEFAAKYAEVLRGRSIRGLKHIVGAKQSNFFGHQVWVMQRYLPPKNTRQWLTRTALWKAIRGTRAGAVIRSVVGR